MISIRWRDAVAWRVRRHFLESRARPGKLLAVTQRLCGLHAQVLSSAELTAWARVEGLQRGAVARALWTDRTLVKTWAMRGTLHLLPAKELGLWHAALGGTTRCLRESLWEKYFGITLAELESLTEAIGQALSGEVMTREELVTAIVRITGSAAYGKKVAESSWGMLLKPAAFTGRLCFAPSVGQRVRFTHPETWVGVVREEVVTAEVMVEIVHRYLKAYGPASYQDLARWWGGGGVTAARKWMALLGDEVVAVDVEGTKTWMLAADAREIRRMAGVRSVRLLPGFDQYVVAASCHADHLLPGDLRGRVYRPQGWISPVLLVNGFMHGVWRHELKGSKVEVTVEAFVDLAAWVKRAAEEEAERLAEFLGGSLKLWWTESK